MPEFRDGFWYVTQEENEQAIELTKKHLWELEEEIGKDNFIGIFDDYDPSCEDQPPSYLIESLFGKPWDDQFRDVHCLIDEYIMAVWREHNRLYKIIEVKPKEQPLQSKWIKVRRAAFERDNYTCQECGVNKKLCGHHIKSRLEYPGLIYEVDNIITLCASCHAKKHPNKANFIMSRR